MELESIMLSEISQTEKHKHSVITYMWNLKKISELIYKAKTHGE